MRGDGAEDLVFGETDCARCGGGNPAAHGRESDSIVGGTLGAIGTCGADCGDYTLMVSRAGLVAARPPSDFVAREGWVGGRHGRAVRLVLAGIAFDGGTGTARVVGFARADWRIVFLGAGLGAIEALAVWHGRV